MPTPEPPPELPEAATPDDGRLDICGGLPGGPPELQPLTSAALAAQLTAPTYVPPPWPARVAAHIPLRIAVRRAARRGLPGVAWRAGIVVVNVVWWLTAAFWLTLAFSQTMQAQPCPNSGFWEAVTAAAAVAAAARVRYTWRCDPGTV